MTQRERQRILGRYKRAVQAYGKLPEKLETSISQSAAKTRKNIREALAELLPILGDCIAELPGVVADLEEKADTLRKLLRQAEAAGLVLRYDKGEE